MAIRNLTFLRYLGLMIEVMLWKWFSGPFMSFLYNYQAIRKKSTKIHQGASLALSIFPIFASRSNSCRRKVSKSVWPERVEVLRSPWSAGND